MLFRKDYENTYNIWCQVVNGAIEKGHREAHGTEHTMMNSEEQASLGIWKVKSHVGIVLWKCLSGQFIPGRLYSLVSPKGRRKFLRISKR